MLDIDNLTTFERAYLECMLWADLPEEYCGDFDITDLAEESAARAVEDCRRFQEENARLLEGLDDEQSGHDFWLSRQGHGAGFWDGELGELGDALHKAAERFGERYVFVEEGKVYCE